MAHSYAEHPERTCPNCQQVFTADIWLIIDMVERPDLADRVLTGTLHQFACTNCNRAFSMDVPLLLYLPQKPEIVLIFSPAQKTTPEEDQQQAIRLENFLAQQVGLFGPLIGSIAKFKLLTIDRRQLPMVLKGLELGHSGEAQSEDKREELPDEQLKIIRQLLKKIDASGMSAEARKEAERELQRLKQQPPQSPEFAVIETYLDWLTKLPWNTITPDNLDIEYARRILDEDHYGLQHVKGWFLEYMAVRKLIHDRNVVDIPPEASSTILCLVGPPGVGKTSLGKSFARALGRHFTRMSLGGVHIESEIRGHRRTYIGALPGRIIQGIKRAGTRNPVFMLDEIDKLGASVVQGDPASALLEVLDPVENYAFRDNYLNIDFDLSQVFFICTANREDHIPEQLLDRMEILHIDGYTLDEKIRIAYDYLIPRQLKANGLRVGELDFTEEALRTIINGYTQEAGVRNLEREIRLICRKAAVRVGTGEGSHAFNTTVVNDEVQITDSPIKGVTLTDEEKNQAAWRARANLATLPPVERARALIEYVTTNKWAILVPEDMTETLFAVLADMQVAAEPGSEQAQRLRTAEIIFQVQAGRYGVVKEPERIETNAPSVRHVHKSPQTLSEALSDFLALLDVSIDKIAPFAALHPEQLRRLGKDERHHTLKPDAIDRLLDATTLVGKALPPDQKASWAIHLKTSSLYTVLLFVAYQRTNFAWPKTPEDHDLIWKRAQELVVYSGGVLYEIEEGEEYQTRTKGGFFGDSFGLYFNWSKNQLETDEDILSILAEFDKLEESE